MPVPNEDALRQREKALKTKIKTVSDVIARRRLGRRLRRAQRRRRRMIAAAARLAPKAVAAKG
jgi:hypothetical protein